MTRNKIQVLLPSLVVFAFGLVGLLYLVPTWVKSPPNIQVRALSPTFWPTILFWGLTVFGGFISLSALLAKEDAVAPDERPQEDGEEGFHLKSVLRTVAAMTVLLVYYLTVDWLGLVLASILAAGALALLAGERRYVAVAIVAVGVPIFLYYFFTIVANTPLPLGMFDRF